ncbi:MAG TPA: sulfite exporter TauE/SafE family protein [Phycisphaerae bacterium]|nr:sulfite exporter TauE/SafE family protein [Phycisphaerae bacterium]
MVTPLLLCLIGFFAGVLGGLLGIGGSIVMIPAMTELLGPQQHLYQAAAMIVNFFVVLPAVIQHHRAGAIMGGVVRRMAPMAVVAVVLGVGASEWSVFRGRGQAWLVLLFAAFLCYVAVRNLLKLRRSEQHHAAEGAPFDPQRDGWKAALVAGLPTGFVGGLLGVGGGIVCVPFQNRFLNIPLRNAIANSAATILTLSLIGAFTKNWALATQHPQYTVAEPLKLAGMLIPTAMVGAWIGSRLTHVLPIRALRIVFTVFLFVAALRMAWHGYDDLRLPPQHTPATPASPAPAP